MSYAENTSVSVAKSKAEIEDILGRYHADRILQASEDGRAVVGFELAQRRMQFTLRLPLRGDFAIREDHWGHKYKRTPEKQQEMWEQACRSQWRALFLTIKAKLVSVESGVETIEEAFLAQTIVPGVKGTFADWAIPAIVKAYEGGNLPPMLPARGQT